MTFSNQLSNLKSRLRHLPLRRNRRPSALTNSFTTKIRLERLEERKVFSGFGLGDGAYLVESWSGEYSDVKIRSSDQKIVAAGRAQDVVLARYDASGNPDLSFATGGLATAPNATINSGELVLQADGKAVVAADSFLNGTYYFGATRFNVDGSPDAKFGNGGWTGVNLGQDTFPKSTAVGLTSAGKIIVGGGKGSIWQSAALTGFKTNGSLDSGRGGFGDVGKTGQSTGYTQPTFGGAAGFNSLAVQSDDKVVVVGDYSAQPSVVGQLLVARFASGVLDKTFNGSGYSTLNLPEMALTTVGLSHNDVAVQADGKIVVVTRAKNVDTTFRTLAIRYTASGALDSTFGGGSGYVQGLVTGPYGGQDVTIQPDGRIVVVSSSQNGTDPSTVTVTRLNTNGTVDTTFGNSGVKLASAGPRFAIKGMALQSDGSIIIAGSENAGTDNSTQHPVLMRFYGSTPSPMMASSISNLSHESNKQIELKRENLMAEVMYDLGQDHHSTDLANTRIASQSATIAPDRAHNIDLVFSSHSDKVDDFGLLVQLNVEFNFVKC